MLKTNKMNTRKRVSSRKVCCYRYAFNGMEKDDQVKGKGNSYDFGARMYDSRLGRWLTIDPIASKYPSLSSFSFVANTPIIALDPDGRYIIFINGEVNSFGGKLNPSSEANKDRANESYWTTKLVRIITRGFDDKKTLFRDGDVSTGAYNRYELGYLRAKADYKDIIANLERDENGKITETIKIISHSKGSAYGAGYQNALEEMRNSDEYKNLFVGDGGKVVMHIMLAPHQSNRIHVGKSKAVTIGITHQWDVLSDDDVNGDVLNISTDNNANFYETAKAHTIDGFHGEVKAAINQYKLNKQSESKNKYNGFTKSIKGASKKVYNRANKSYE